MLAKDRYEWGWCPDEKTKSGATPLANKVRDLKDFGGVRAYIRANGTPWKNEVYLDSLHITFSGAMATVPSLKNGKGFGNNMSANCRAWVTAATEMYGKNFYGGARLEDRPIAFPANCRVFMFVTCKTQDRKFDAHNWAETIADWLEPSSKKVGKKHQDRGWGVGVVEDDYYITSLADHAENVQAHRNCTQVHLIRDDLVNEHYLSLYGACLTQWEKAQDETS